MLQGFFGQAMGSEKHFPGRVNGGQLFSTNQNVATNTTNIAANTASIGVLNTQMQVYFLKAQEFSAAEKKKADATRTPNTGRPLPKLPASKNDVLTKLEQGH